MRADSNGVDDPLGDPLTIEVGQFLDEMVVLEQSRSAGTCGLGVLVIRDRCTGCGRQGSARGVSHAILGVVADVEVIQR